MGFKTQFTTLLARVISTKGRSVCLSVTLKTWKHIWNTR